MKLYYFPYTFNSRKVLAVVHHLGIAPELRLVDLLAGEQLRPEFVALNPNHMVPTLEDGDFVLWESNAIMQYLAAIMPGGGLWPADARLQADVARWQSWQLAHWGAQACAPLVFENEIKALAGRGAPDPAAVARAEQHFHRCARVLEGHLGQRRWLVGNDVTLADFGVAAPLMHAETARLPIEDYGALRRWYERVAGLDAWQKSAPPPVARPPLNGGQDHAVHAAHL